MRMFYTLDPACGTKETGNNFPQIQDMLPKYDWKGANSINKLSRCRFAFPDFEPNLDGLVIKSKTKITDLLITAMLTKGMMISPKFKSLLEGFNLGNVKFYPSRIYYKGTFLVEYFCMHILPVGIDVVDIAGSTFLVKKMYRTILYDIEIETKEDYLKKTAVLKEEDPKAFLSIWSKKIKLNELFDDSLSLFEIGTFDSDYYISESLASSILSSGMTGCDIKQSIKFI